MLPADLSLTFFGVALALCVSPGPDNLFVLMQSALYGPAAGLRVVTGLCSGILLHTTAVALGLAAVLAASPTAFALLKLAGAGYLLYLALLAWRAPAAAVDDAGASPLTGMALYRRGVVMNISNPKVLLFFFALLPQFTRVSSGPVSLQIVWLGLIFAISTLLVFGAVALFAGQVGDLLRRSPQIQRILHRGAALVFVAMAATLLLTEGVKS